jgi:prepilin signal peptidase PulO-like enzyme (type II secretory pathway)
VELVLHTLVLFGVVGAASGPLLARFAARRSAAQPLHHHPHDEERVIATVLAHPSSYAALAELEPEHFTSEERRAAWSAIAEASGIQRPSGTLGKAEIERLGTQVRGDLSTVVGSRLDITRYREPFAPEERKAFLRAASQVFNAGLDRTEYVGRARVVYVPGGEPPVVRVVPPPSRAQKTGAALLGCAGGVTAALIGAKVNPLAVLALCLLAAGSVLWTLVDLDTLYIDAGTFWPAATVIWALTLASLWQAGETLALAVMGLVSAGLVVALLEILSQVIGRLRGQPGMGTGDYQLILVMVGVPVALTGDWSLGYWVVNASALFALAAWAVARLRDRTVTRSTPFAFGPALAAGWVTASLIREVML